MSKILLAGAYGQMGQELIRALSSRIGPHNLVCADVRPPPANINPHIHEELNLMDRGRLFETIEKHKITQVYCLAALLSATGEIDPLRTEEINMKSLYNCLQAARLGKINKIFWPSSIAAFGESTPKRTPQLTVMEPTTVYGITKKNGELWCSYYHRRYGVDVRSIRYPGLVGYRSPPGGGTTDYAVDIYHKAILGKKFTCYLQEGSYLPMVYTDDAIDGAIQLMEAPKQRISIRTSYNINSLTFDPKEIFEAIKKEVPGFEMEYKIDPLRQHIANSWPHYLQDEQARRDWGWNPRFDLDGMTRQILRNLTPEMIRKMESS